MLKIRFVKCPVCGHMKTAGFMCEGCLLVRETLEIDASKKEGRVV